jgi:hypothetical protein
LPIHGRLFAIPFSIELAFDSRVNGGTAMVEAKVQETWGDEPASAVRSTTGDATTLRPPKITPFESEIPTVAVDAIELLKLPLGQRAGFLLSLMDGHTTVETLLDLCFIPTDEALVLLDEMMRQGIVTFA